MRLPTPEALCLDGARLHAAQVRGVVRAPCGTAGRPSCTEDHWQWRQPGSTHFGPLVLPGSQAGACFPAPRCCVAPHPACRHACTCAAGRAPAPAGHSHLPAAGAAEHRPRLEPCRGGGSQAPPASGAVRPFGPPPRHWSGVRQAGRWAGGWRAAYPARLLQQPCDQLQAAQSRSHMRRPAPRCVKGGEPDAARERGMHDSLQRMLSRGAGALKVRCLAVGWAWGGCSHHGCGCLLVMHQPHCVARLVAPDVDALSPCPSTPCCLSHRL